MSIDDPYVPRELPSLSNIPGRKLFNNEVVSGSQLLSILDGYGSRVSVDGNIGDHFDIQRTLEGVDVDEFKRSNFKHSCYIHSDSFGAGSGSVFEILENDEQSIRFHLDKPVFRSDNYLDTREDWERFGAMALVVPERVADHEGLSLDGRELLVGELHEDAMQRWSKVVATAQNAQLEANTAPAPARYATDDWLPDATNALEARLAAEAGGDAQDQPMVRQRGMRL